MSAVQHLSMRVPWRDRPWDSFICNDPLANSSCTLLRTIGPKRDDDFEVANASASIDTLDQGRLPCLSERATFMSPIGYSVTKEHPYAWNRALKGLLHPTPVSVPGFSFEAVPFRWLNRKSLEEEIGLDRVPGYSPDAEDHVDDSLGYRGASWVMDGTNQRAVLSAFFEPVTIDDSLVFMYLKHSPLQEARTERLLVGAARITDINLPPMWKQTGSPPFSSSMWETIVTHSLRSKMTDGVLLPYQQLVQLMDEGADVDPALAWAPKGREIEFSCVTEHLSDDAAIEALSALEQAAIGMQELGIDLPSTARDWLTSQIDRLWRMRGPVPGLAAAFDYLGVQRPLCGRESCPRPAWNDQPVGDARSRLRRPEPDAGRLALPTDQADRKNVKETAGFAQGGPSAPLGDGHHRGAIDCVDGEQGRAGIDAGGAARKSVPRGDLYIRWARARSLQRRRSRPLPTPACRMGPSATRGGRA